VPVIIKHLDGNCHSYVDEPCDIDLALKVVDNAKTQKYSPCNATESLLVARGVAPQFLPRIARVFAAKGVQMRCDAESLKILEENQAQPLDGQAQSAINTKELLRAAQESDWSEEYLAPIISVKVVRGWKRPLPTSTATAATTPMPSSRPITCTHSVSCARSIPPA